MVNTWRYKAYLLRMWPVEQNGQVVWRASLEDSQTGEVLGFANLELLFDFLKGKGKVSYPPPNRFEDDS